MNLRFIGSKIPLIMRMNWVGAFARPDGGTRDSYQPKFVVKAIFCLSAVAMRD